MREKQKKDNTPKPSKKILIVAVILVAAIAVLLAFIPKTERSAQAFCNTYNEEDARLSTLPGDTYPSGVFNEDISDAGEFAMSFSRLEKVAPEEIRADVSTLQSIYQKIDEDPSQAIAASLSGVQAEENVVDWINSNCSTNN